MKPIFKCIMGRNAQLIPTCHQYADHCRALEGQKVDVTITRHRKQRSYKQNAFYWSGVIPLLANEFGYAVHEQNIVHDAMRLMFLKTHRKGLDVIKSTTDLSTVEMEEYIENIRKWAILEHNISVPEPNEISF